MTDACLLHPGQVESEQRPAVCTSAISGSFFTSRFDVGKGLGFFSIGSYALQVDSVVLSPVREA